MKTWWQPIVAASLSVAVMVGCGAGGLDNDDDSSDDARTCSVAISFAPGDVVAGAGVMVRANGEIDGGSGFLNYQWSVKFGGADVPFSSVAEGGRDIEFEVALPGVYDLTFAIDDCQSTSAMLTATAAGANDLVYRLRVQPPSIGNLPASEQTVIVRGGGNASLGTIGVSPGVLVNGQVSSGGAPVESYLRLAPLSQPELLIEQFSDQTGAFLARTLAEPYSLLVVPTSPLLAPMRLSTWQPLSPNIEVSAGVPVQVSVQLPSGLPLEAANVSVSVDGVPSTIVATNAAGLATVRVQSLAATGNVVVTVAPRSPSPWPDLTATLSGVDLTQQVVVSFASGLALRSLTGASVLQNSVALDNAVVDLVLERAGAGTVVIGASTAAASARDQVRGTTNGSGVLTAPSLVGGPLTVVAAKNSNYAITTIDTSSSVPTSINLPLPQPLTLRVLGPTGIPLEAVRGTAIPRGPLAMVHPGARVTISSSTGILSWPGVVGASWDIFLEDPARRAGRLDLRARENGALADVTLPSVVLLGGTVKRADNSASVGGAVVTLFCTACSAVESLRPLATAVASSTGVFTLAVPDPGVQQRELR